MASMNDLQLSAAQGSVTLKGGAFVDTVDRARIDIIGLSPNARVALYAWDTTGGLGTWVFVDRLTGATIDVNGDILVAHGASEQLAGISPTDTAQTWTMTMKGCKECS